MAFYFGSVLFCYPISSLSDRGAASPSEQNQRVCLRFGTINCLRHFARLSTNFTGGVKVRNSASVLQLTLRFSGFDAERVFLGGMGEGVVRC